MGYIQSVTIRPKKVYIKKGEWFYGLTRTVNPSYAESCAEWVSDNGAKATINLYSGHVYGLNEGTVNIRIRECDYSWDSGDEYCELTVMSEHPSWSEQANKVIEIAERFKDQYYYQVNQTAQEVFGRSANLPAQDWCDKFVRLVLSIAGYNIGAENVICASGGATTILNWYKNYQCSRYHSGTSGIQKGDILFFKYDGDVNPHHIGFALGNNGSGKIDTISGNWSDKVSDQMMPCTSGKKTDRIMGYVHPDYTCIS